MTSQETTRHRYAFFAASKMDYFYGYVHLFKFAANTSFYRH